MRYSGAEIFQMTDTYGLPLDVINMMLRERGGFFPTEEFVTAAKKAGWKSERIYHTLISASPLQGERLEELKNKIKELVE